MYLYCHYCIYKNEIQYSSSNIFENNFANILKIKSNSCMHKQELIKFFYFKIIKL